MECAASLGEARRNSPHDPGAPDATGPDGRLSNFGSSDPFVGWFRLRPTLGPAYVAGAPRSGHAALAGRCAGLAHPPAPLNPQPALRRCAPTGASSSSLVPRSSSTRAVGLCLTRRRLRALVLWWGRKVKVKGASGGPAQRAEGERCQVGVVLVGGGVRSGAPFACPRRQPGFCREVNRRKQNSPPPKTTAG